MAETPGFIEIPASEKGFVPPEPPKTTMTVKPYVDKVSASNGFPGIPSIPGQSGQYGGINPGGTMYTDPNADNYIGNSMNEVGSPTVNSEGANGYIPPVPPTVEPRAITADETVEGRLNNLLGGNSKYIEQARQSTAGYAASRNLQNSSIAAGAGEREAIRAGLAIAQQDAQTYGTAGQSAQEARQLGTIEGFRGEVSSGLSAQDARQALELEQFKQGSATATQDKESYTKLASGIQQEYQKKYLEIQQTADSIMDETAKIRAINILNRSTQSQMEMLNSLYNVDMTWGSGISTPTGSGYTPVGSTPPPTGGGNTQPPGDIDFDLPPPSTPPETGETPPVVNPGGGIGSAPFDDFRRQLESSGAYESDSYFQLSQSLPTASYEWTPDPAENSRRQKAAQDKQAMDTFSTLAFSLANPEDQELIKAITVKPTLVWNKMKYPDTPEGRISQVLHQIPYVDPNQLPPSQRESLPWWQKWVNQYIYNNTPPPAPTQQEPAGSGFGARFGSNGADSGADGQSTGDEGMGSSSGSGSSGDGGTMA